MRTARLPTVSCCIPCPGGGTHPPGYTHPLPGHAHPPPGHAHAPDIHTHPLLDISTHQKGPGTRGTERQRDTCENITFRQIRWRAVILQDDNVFKKIKIRSRKLIIGPKNHY